MNIVINDNIEHESVKALYALYPCFVQRTFVERNDTPAIVKFDVENIYF